ncbi:ABC transporter permease [Marinovum algicola]|uniref:Peptide/nickel transport system permease protein n=1 Tax=Marinovum algicola TaxID=42444 RepID=A0A975WCD4_9RHOB|nr:ABC transporter permease [Marinovum algicola]SEJ90102.1 peptide/nickel transport system permease protein [Marinovum algicola]SLN43519.1 Oligopeptide transport system permease protein OppC [Marinovum algicola]
MTLTTPANSPDTRIGAVSDTPEAPIGEVDPRIDTRHGTESQWQLIRRRFAKHRLAVISLWVLALFVFVALFAGFVAPNDPGDVKARYTYAPPQALHFIDRADDGWAIRPYVYGYSVEIEPEALRRTFVIDEDKKIYLSFFKRSWEYKLFGLIPTDIHLLGPERNRDPFYLFGADRLGRDMFSRLVYGTQISLSVGLVGVIMSLVLGVIIGGAAGYFGGWFDAVTQRAIEFLRSLPTIPLWMGLAAAMPSDWSPLQTYFAITLILSFLGWTELARVVRGRFLALNGEDYVAAARYDGCSHLRVILRHMVPAFTSHIITAASLAVPAMILAETALSFLGLGLQAPVISWGVLLQEAQNIRTLATAPWLLLPGAAIVIAVLAMNFIGDGLRDAADPYAK